jgi:shikimate kinase
MRPTETIHKKIEVSDGSRSATYRPGRVSEPSQARSNIFLVGPRGSGKTTLGRLLAERLNRPFLDTDELILAKSGRPIADIVNEQGWEEFRNMEHAVLAEVCARSHQVVATGGGIVLMQENRSLMKSCGRVFYLLADPPLLLQRLTQEPLAEQRPPLSGLPLQEELARTLTERSPLYMECADFILRAEEPSDELAFKAEELLAL